MKLSAIIGNSERAAMLEKFWKERGPDDEETLLVTAALMSGEQELSPVTALSISESIRTAEAAEYTALLTLAKSMASLESVGSAVTNNKLSKTFQAEIADAIISIGRRVLKFGSFLRRNKVSTDQ